MPIQGDTLNHQPDDAPEAVRGDGGRRARGRVRPAGDARIVNETGSGILVDPTDTRVATDHEDRRALTSGWPGASAASRPAHERYNWETQVRRSSTGTAG